LHIVERLQPAEPNSIDDFRPRPLLFLGLVVVRDMDRAFEVHEHSMGFVARFMAFDPHDALLSATRHVALAKGGALRQKQDVVASLLPASGLRTRDGNRVARIRGRQLDLGENWSSRSRDEEKHPEQRWTRELGEARNEGATASRAVCREPNADSGHPGERLQRGGFLAGKTGNLLAKCGNSLDARHLGGLERGGL
jgi:hypothetical protein